MNNFIHNPEHTTDKTCGVFLFHTLTGRCALIPRANQMCILVIVCINKHNHHIMNII